MNHSRYILFLCALLPVLICAQNVSDVTVHQRGEQIEVSYLTDKEADVSLYAIINGKKKLCETVSGDIGANVPSGKHTAVWNVLSDMDELIGEAYFEVYVTQSTRSQQAEQTAKQRQLDREKKMADICPLAGFDISFGLFGIGGSVYWPWVTNRPSRVGSYVSYIYGAKDWLDSDIDNFHNICLGVTVTLSEHFALFAAPGLSIANSSYDLNLSSLFGNRNGNEFDEPYDILDFSSYSSDYSSSSRYDDLYVRWAVEGGVSMKWLIFSFSVKVAYPFYAGLGVGLDFGGL